MVLSAVAIDMKNKKNKLGAHNRPKEKTAKRKYARTSTIYNIELSELKSNCGSCVHTYRLLCCFACRIINGEQYHLVVG